MSYYVSRRGLGWGLIFSSWQDGKRKDQRIKKKDLSQYGFRADMSVEEAKARVSQLNKETIKDRTGERSKVRALNEAGKERKLQDKNFPAKLVKEFEEKTLRRKFEFGGANPQQKFKKVVSRWRFARKMAIEVDLRIEDWADEPRIFYAYLQKNKISLDYAGKVLSVLNLWGYFLAKKQGRAFLPIPAPRAHDAQAIADAYGDSAKPKKEALPLTRAILEASKAKLNPIYYNWLFVSLWFGLRPTEVTGAFKVIEETKDGASVRALAIYQTKLTGLSKEKRWKYIPILYPEQETALKILDSQSLKRPPKTAIKAALPEGYGLYSGRKGFIALMKSLGQTDLYVIAKWLGHSNVSLAFRTYWSDTKIVLDKKAS